MTQEIIRNLNYTVIPSLITLALQLTLSPIIVVQSTYFGMSSATLTCGMFCGKNIFLGFMEVVPAWYEHVYINTQFTMNFFFVLNVPEFLICIPSILF